MPLPAVGTLSYNGYTFDGSSRIVVRRTNVRDEADRTTVYVLYEIMVDAVVASGNGSSIDSSMDTIYSALTCEGGVLQLTNAGVGNALQVNIGIHRDVKWGPKPQMIYWKPIGSHGAAEIQWQCRVALDPCQNTSQGVLVAGLNKIMALNYEVQFDIDNNGDTVRTVSGYLEISMTRVNNAIPCNSTQVPDSADRYRDQVLIEPPLGFIRNQTWKISKDKTRADFTIVDKQIPSPNPYPTGVTAITGHFSVNIVRSSMAINKCSLSMQITPNRGINGAIAWQYFRSIFQKRRTLAEQAGHKVLLQSINLEEDLFGRPAAFRVDYFIYSDIKTNPVFADPVKGTGLWSSLGNDWDSWRKSIANSTFHNRGNALLINDPSNDRITNLCNPSGSNPQSPTTTDNPNQPTTQPAFQSSTPTPEKSYLHYQSGNSIITDTPTAKHKPLQDDGSTAATPNPQQDDPGSALDAIGAAVAGALNGTGFDVNNKTKEGAPSVGTKAPSMQVVVTGTASAGSSSKFPDVLQVRGLTNHRIRFFGTATRIGYKVPRPCVQSVGGQPVKEIRAVFSQKLVGIFFGQPVYKASWDMIYHVALDPTKGPITVKVETTPVAP